MYENLLNLLKLVNESDINKDFIYINEENEFIFENLNEENIIGTNELLRNNVISVLDEKEKNNNKYIKIKIDSQSEGWIKKEKCIRVYRLPKINGKITEEIDRENSVYESHEKLDVVINKIIKAYYYFNYLDIDYLLVAQIGSKNYIPIKMSDFHRLLSTTNNTQVNLNRNQELYLTSNYNNIDSKLEDEGAYKVHAYFKGLSEMRIQHGKKRYWIKHDTKFLDAESFSFDRGQLELMDYITYLTDHHQFLLNKNRNYKYIINQIKKNVVIDNESQELFLNKYIGDNNVNK